MKKAKQILSVLLAVLMVLSAVPVAFAAVDGEQRRVEVSGNSLVQLGSGYEYYDEDGYILTGDSEANIVLYEPCSVTLDNLTAYVLNEDDADQSFNVVLKGENKITYAFEVGSHDFEISAVDEATLAVPRMYTGGNDGTVTVNSGTVNIAPVSEDSAPAVDCGDFIVNGGTVTASNDSFVTVNGSVHLNGGTLHISNTSLSHAAVAGNITIGRDALLTISGTNGLCTSAATIEKADGLGENDFFFVKYDTESEFAPVADIKAALDGENYAEIMIDTHMHSYTDGSCACGYVCTHENMTDGECPDCDFECTAHDWANNNGICVVCNYECNHDDFADGICTVCNYECNHDDFADGECPDCGFKGMFIEIKMKDSFGDGWNGNKLLIKNDSGEEIGVATFDEGYDDTYTFLLAEDVKFTLTWQEGSYAAECSFEVAVDGENVFKSETCDYYENDKVVYIYCAHTFEDGVCTKCNLKCPHEYFADGECPDCGFKGMFIDITMHDSSGDGWYDKFILIKNDSDKTIGFARIVVGKKDTYSFMIAEDESFSLIWQEENHYSSEECSFEVAVDGETVFESEKCDNYENGEVVYSYCAHTFEDGVCTKCGNPCLHDTDNGTCSICGEYVYAITHQPTEAEPYVELNDDTDASYQWYKVEDMEEITDENAGTVSCDRGDSSYEAETGWTGVPYYEGLDEHAFFTVALHAGDTVKVELTGDFHEWVGLFDYETKKGFYEAIEPGINTYEITVTDDGNYTFYTYVVSGVVTAKAYLGDFAIEGETDARLQNPEFGAEYFCEVTFADGTTEKSDILDLPYRITHQPTEAEPYVELNDDTDASYKWYKVEGMEDITDENADTVSYDWGDSSYDAETGWTGVPHFEGNYQHDFFTVALKAGDTVKVELTGDFYDWVGLYNYAAETVFYEEIESGINTYEITVPDDGKYTFYTYVDSGAVTVKAYLGDLVCSEIEGEAGAALRNPAYGYRYLCEVTFADGTTEQSDILDLSYRITHQPTEAEPYVELNDATDASYQWYVFERKTVEITDENATALTPEFLGAPEDITFTHVASYGAEYGWESSVIPRGSGNAHFFFAVNLKAGDVVYVTFSAAPDDSQLLTIDGKKIADAETEDGIHYSFTVLEDGLYGLQAQSNGQPSAKASMLTDVSSILDGETDAHLQNPEFGAEYYCAVTFADGTTEESDILDLSYRITHQPTAGEPYVELNNDTDASYQWHEIEYGTIEITNENATALNGDICNAKYVPGEGWHVGLQYWYSDGHYLSHVFERDFEAGDQIILDVETTETAPELWLGGSDDFTYVGFKPDENGRLCATVELTDSYQLFSGNLYDPDMIIKAYLYSKNTSVALEGETDARLQNPEIGAEYYCEVTFADDTTEMSDAFEYKYVITHQPTEEEPYVELNDDTDATYQWYKVEGMGEITDENADTVSYDWGNSSYGAETGWTGVRYVEYGNGQEFFTVALHAGDTVKVELTGDFCNGVGLYNHATNKDFYEAIEPGINTYEITVPDDGDYTFYTFVASGAVTVKAYFGDLDCSAIDSQTTDTLTPDAIGHYACKVTFADGTTEMSDTFEVTSVHTCDFSGDWEYDNAKHWKECTADDCNAVSEEAEHEFLDGECTVCDYVCDHANATTELIRPVQNADGTWGQGSIVTTCPDCENVDTEYVNRADYTAFDAAVAKLQAILAREDLIDGPKAGYAASLNAVVNGVGYNKVVTEQDSVNSGTRTINGFIATLEAGLADNTMKKADLSYMTALLDEVNALIDRNTSNIIPSESGRYTGPNGYYKAAINNGNYSQADHDRSIAAYDYENQLETLIAGLKDGTMRKADYTEIDEVIAGIDEALKTATVSDEMQAELDGIKKELDALKSEENTSAADLANSGLLARAKAIAATMADCANGDHSFTTYEEVTSPDCDDAGKKVAVCDNGCGATDEKAIDALGHTELPAVKENEVEPDCENEGSYDLVVYCDVCDEEISRVTETVDALGHTERPAVKENEVKPDCENAGSYDLVVYCDVCDEELSRVTETVDALGHSFTLYTVTVEPSCEEAGVQIAVCDNGCGATDEQAIPELGHTFTQYVSNNDATCEADGTKTALCDNGCGTRETVTDEGSKLDHIDEDGDDFCDDCGGDLRISVEDCPCTCHHKDPVNAFIYKIIQFIRRVFGINSSCDCGTVHTEGLTPFWKIFDLIAE